MSNNPNIKALFERPLSSIEYDELFDLLKLQWLERHRILTADKSYQIDNRFTAVKAIIELFPHISISRVECFVVLALDTRNRVVGAKHLYSGTFDTVNVYPRDIVQFMLDVDAIQLIAAHNHPSGVCTPSDADIAITKRINRVLRDMEMKILDHIIIGLDREDGSLISASIAELHPDALGY